MISEFGEDLMPRRRNRGDAGYDICMPEDATMVPGETYVFDTGIRLEDGDIAEDEFIMMVPRSSMGFRYGLRFSNTIGVIDAGYRETMRMSITVERPCELKRGDRVAQLIVCRFGTIRGEIPPDGERNGGIGSTGVRRWPWSRERDAPAARAASTSWWASGRRGAPMRACRARSFPRRDARGGRGMRGYRRTPRDVAVLEALRLAGPTGATSKELKAMLPEMDTTEIGWALRSLRERGEVRRCQSGYSRSRGQTLWMLYRRIVPDHPAWCLRTMHTNLFEHTYYISLLYYNRMMTSQQLVSFRLDKEDRRNFIDLCDTLGVDMSTVCRLMVKSFINTGGANVFTAVNLGAVSEREGGE